MPKHYGKKFEQEQRKQKPLERDVLKHLKEHGPSHYDGLYVLFDPHRKAYIAPVLHDLREWNYIKLNTENNVVDITDAGLRLLEDRDYWLT